MPKNNQLLLATYPDSGSAKAALQQAESANLRAFTDLSELEQNPPPEMDEISSQFSRFSNEHGGTVVGMLAPLDDQRLQRLIREHPPKHSEVV